MSTAEADGTAVLDQSDAQDLAKFGYRQELHRSLGSFSSFAAGFSYISILTGVFQLFGFGFGLGGPAYWWSWPMVFIGQGAVAFCFAEMAGQYPIAGSVYQWSKRVASPLTSFLSGWIMVVGAIVTIAAVAVAYQVILPQISTGFEVMGSSADAGLYSTPGGAKNAVVLALGLVVFTTAVNLIGVKLMAKINNFGVAVELTASAVLVVMLAVHITRGPQVILKTLGTGAGHTGGYFGAFMVAAIASAYVFYGFDTAGQLAEETLEPRKHAPRAIMRAMLAAFVIGGLLMLFAMMSVKNISDSSIASLGLPYIIKQALGSGIGDVFLIASAIAITVCCLAVQTACIRVMFSMSRDKRLPFSKYMANISPRSGVPKVPALVTGMTTILLLLLNIGNQKVFYTLVSIAIILFYVPYLCVTAPMLLRRLRGGWPNADHGPYYHLGRWGLPINVVAVVYGIFMIINLAWPRTGVYGSGWYYQYGGIMYPALVVLLGGAYYVAKLKPAADAEARTSGEPGATVQPT